MNDNDLDVTTDVALAALVLACHNTRALLRAGLLKPGERAACAQALRSMSERFPQTGKWQDELIGVREMVALLEAPE